MREGMIKQRQFHTAGLAERSFTTITVLSVIAQGGRSSWAIGNLTLSLNSRILGEAGGMRTVQ